MKKLIPIFLMIIILSSCVSNKYDYYDYPTKPLPRPVAYVTSLVPGLTQIINGEYLEAAVYMSVFGLGMFMYLKPEGLTDPYEEANTTYPLKTTKEIDEELKAISGLGLLNAGMWLAINYIDGVYSTNERYDQWTNISNQKIEESLKAIELQKKKDEEKKQKLLEDKILEKQRLEVQSRFALFLAEAEMAGIPVIISDIQTDKNSNIQFTITNTSNKIINYILIEARPIDETGKWILPIEGTNTKTIRSDSVLEKNGKIVISENFYGWFTSDYVEMEVMYIKIIYSNDEIYETNDSDVLKKIIYKTEASK